ncbi:probable inactive purple acid phosphatase 27 [Camellia sinensis]|uniref:probable inactive purple acid phosphatase 27 n=1 Tax=Camellia sinensis TaxID=4442 RepID=UPI0010364CA0|nr:probable inactive purple acid phosphatase 27 [Camellia sinensis]
MYLMMNTNPQMELHFSFRFVFTFFIFFQPCLSSSSYFSSSSSSSSSSSLLPLIINSTHEFRNYTAISEFRVLNRRVLGQCPDPNPYLQINVSSNSDLSDDEFVTVTVSGVLVPGVSDWVAMISPSTSDVSDCPLSSLQYKQTGDLSSLPLLCHYPVKAQYVNNDPDYISCKKKECKEHNNKGECVVSTCSGSLSFHVINIRTDIEFVFFTAGFDTPCILKRSVPLKFANPKQPLYGHLSSIDSTATSMRLTWVSGDKEPQQVQYGGGKSQTSQVTTFSPDNMCSSSILPSPAKDFGWHDPGYIHSAVMTGLKPSSTFSYRYGSNSVGWSDQIQFTTPAVGGSDELRFLAFGDMGKAPRDASVEHYIQPGSLSVTKAMASEVASGNVDSIFHIGDISYATGFLVEWDFFLHLISPVASQVSYMTAIGNHERDYVDSGSVYTTPDSGGECGVPYETYFPMPTPAKDKPWYSIEQGPVHFTVISTEHDWSQNSEQYDWMNKDMASVDRSKTPWIIFAGHRPMYSSSSGILPSVDNNFVQAVEPLLLANKVDLVLFGHVHNYERTCAVYQNECKAMPKKDGHGIDTYDNTNYSAPVQVVIGMAGFNLDKSPASADSWSLARISEFGYVRVHATRQDLTFEYVNANTRKVEDSFRITKS